MIKISTLAALAAFSVASAAAIAPANAEPLSGDQQVPAAALPLPDGPVAMALSQAVPSHFGSDSAVTAFYAARGFAPVWLDARGKATDASAALVTALAERPAHALPPAPLATEDLSAALLGRGAPSDRAALEIAMTDVYLIHAREIASGLLEPRKVDRELYVNPERPEAAALMVTLAAASDPFAHMTSLAPSGSEYALLVEKYGRFQKLAAGDGWGAPVKTKKTLRPGDRHNSVVTIRERLIAMGDLRAPMELGSAVNVLVAANDTASDAVQGEPAQDFRVYDAEVVAAVKTFQARHGLNEDGVVGPATRAAMNLEPGFRARQVAVNLERLRWLNRDLGQRHILVNLAGYDMRVVEDGKPVFTSRVVVGKRHRHRTPEFSDEMEHMVVNPSWNVPKSIAREEILPKLQEDPNYLARKGMRLIGSPLAAEQIDWSLVTPSTFPGRVKQAPGRGNALGRVKFMFPNRHAIYLHDTPSRHLFARDRRDYSHGCVRVQKPLEFAEFLLTGQVEDPKASFSRWLASGRERYVHLDKHLPVHITYRTAWHEAESGTDQFRDDIYRRDKRVIAALEKAGVALDF